MKKKYWYVAKLVPATSMESAIRNEKKYKPYDVRLTVKSTDAVDTFAVGFHADIPAESEEWDENYMKKKAP